MVILQENVVKFNNNLHVSHTGGRLSSDSGLILVDEFMNTINFGKNSKEIVSYEDHRLYHQHGNDDILKQLILQLVAGYPTDSVANTLRHDPFYQNLFSTKDLASQSSISRYFDRITEQTIDDFQTLNKKIVNQARLVRNDTNMIIDLDSTHSDTFGNQEQTNYNTHYGITGYHPLVAFDGITGDFLKAKLRPGNVYTSNGVDDFLEPLLQHYTSNIPTTDILVRGDSGFATPTVYELCEQYDSYYTIRLKSNRKLAQLAEQFVLYDTDHPWDEREEYYFTLPYRASSWTKSRRVCIQSVREAGELLFRHSFIVTNFSENITSDHVFKTYNKRGAMENYIKEAKNSFYFDKTDSSEFIVNHARMMISVLAYNIINFLKTTCFHHEWSKLQIDTIRFRLFKVAGKVVNTARKVWLRLSTSHVYQAEFYYVFREIQRIQQFI